MRFCRIKLLTLGCKFYSLFVIDVSSYEMKFDILIFLTSEEIRVEEHNFQSIIIKIAADHENEIQFYFYFLIIR